MWELLLGEGAKRRGAAGGPQTLRVPGRAEMGAGGGKGRKGGKEGGREAAEPGGEARRGGAARPGHTSPARGSGGGPAP